MPADYPPLVREYDDRIYPISAYYIAKILSFLPIFTVDGIVLVLSSYFFVGFPINVVTFLRQMITCMIIEWNVAPLGIAVCAVSLYLSSFTFFYYFISRLPHPMQSQ